ncbi:hypothetical protein C496_19910 [Natronorubrum tibetense GA33]|uniref:Uncharacterized protein n=1 Tax=Natronorubrum tibetense GA33 TaxID=1114856 RepID=L9VLF1_9EURY|nr:hypothetical protein C496_19910 [Natronorubrum tibetense GA33]
MFSGELNGLLEWNYRPAIDNFCCDLFAGFEDNLQSTIMLVYGLSFLSGKNPEALEKLRPYLEILLSNSNE